MYVSTTQPKYPLVYINVSRDNNDNDLNIHLNTASGTLYISLSDEEWDKIVEAVENARKEVPQTP